MPADFIAFADGRVDLIVADVAGKGIPASLIMSSLHARVHVLFEDGDDVAGKVTRLNKHTCGNCPDNRFITFFTAVVQASTGEVVYANAGHNPALIVRASGGFDTLAEGGLILGIMPAYVYKSASGCKPIPMMFWCFIATVSPKPSIRAIRISVRTDWLPWCGASATSQPVKSCRRFTRRCSILPKVRHNLTTSPWWWPGSCKRWLGTS